MFSIEKNGDFSAPFNRTEVEIGDGFPVYQMDLVLRVTIGARGLVWVCQGYSSSIPAFHLFHVNSDVFDTGGNTSTSASASASASTSASASGSASASASASTSGIRSSGSVKERSGVRNASWVNGSFHGGNSSSRSVISPLLAQY